MVGNQHSPYAGSGTDSNFANSPAINVQAAHNAREVGPTHQRTYQACIPCRQRKVRCDLGSVDNPHEPPCLRCRRESKDCYFSSTRRKKRADNNDDGDLEEEDVYVVKAGRKRARVDPVHVVEEPVERPRTPGGSVGRAQPLRRPTQTKSQLFGEDDIKASEQTTAILQGAEVHGGHDALKVLMEAAGIRGRTASATNNSARPSFSTTMAALPAATSPISHHLPGNGQAVHTVEPPVWKLRSDQATTIKPSFIDQIPTGAPGYKSAIRAWSRFKFVRNGWFTAKEGMAYVIYFYTYLSPLTPVTLPNLNDFQIHERLLTHESVLAVTILLIASRHMPLEGAGATSRPFTIHNKLWRYLQGMIDRVTWGQEQFGGGFFCAGSQPGCDVNPLTRKGLRTLGTVESLMLLTEWHPRAMHFPPDEADDELMVPDSPIDTPDTDSMDDSGKGIGGQRMDSWLEPCWRSDRMCWMLLGMAMSLAFEIGVFDKSEWQRHAYSPTGQPMSAEEMQEYDSRRGNIRDLLLIYVTMTSGRLGLTSMLPNSYSKPEDSELFKSQLGEHTSIQQTVLHFWLRIAAIMREGNRKIFANKTYTRDLIKTGNYKDVLEQCRRPLAQWRREFDDCQVIPTYMRYILAIEYEYTRVYLNSLSLQALAERCANEKPQPGSAPADPRSTITTNGIRTDVAIAPQALHKWLGGDRVYMNEVRDAACSLLKIVINGLYPGEYLRHAPVRSYFRIISVAIMLLKSFSLGASEADVSDSLKLMDQTVVALRNCIVDDVHVASRFADLLDVLVQNLKPRLVRMSGDGRNARSRKQSVRTTPTSGADVPSNGAASMSGQRSYYAGANVWTPYSAMSANPLAGISDDSYDMSGGHEYSIMPPPTFGMLASPDSTGSASLPTAGVGGYGSTYDNGFGGSAHYANGFGTGGDDAQDWFALPLDPILGLAGADVNQTMYGPELGGQDMLELLLNGSNYQ